MGKLLKKLHLKISLADRYIISQFIPPLIFAVAICTILGELVGITFEQIRFISRDGLPINIAAYIHLLKLPAFITLALPMAFLIATIITFSQLSARSEIIALQSFGVSLYRIIIPVLFVSLIVTGFMFVFHEFIVPPANYRAAMILEKEWGVDRTKLAKYNKREIIYQQFETNKLKPHLKLLFIANRFDGKQMQGVTLFKYQNKKLQEIIIAQAAQWNEKQQLWQLLWGRQDILNPDGTYAQTRNFEKLSLKLTKNILDFANHHRDRREMNIMELYRRLKLITNTNNVKKIRQLKISIQERYAHPFSCFVFTLLGSSLGISAGTTSKSNSLGIAAIAIFSYFFAQIFFTALAVVGVISIFCGVWLPNFLGLLFGFYFLAYRSAHRIL
ncbi:LptF/LptG family permease [Pleurocapsa sp. PCC 7319]|uniref:LptF/LptG family permease n=1 Tax=Pleurocapsa sp. PCC 7319 TaxID=118161 RepID=UPI00038052D8|nr:LptF/LptG family permease [Pleurocapsa sp. PCC 7319]